MTRDGGLTAVARIRGVEERASRIDLERGLRQVNENEIELRTREDRIVAAEPFGSGSAADYVHTRISLGHMARTTREAAVRLETSKQVAAEAHRAWVQRKTRLRAVELLLERREQRRREERDRRERTELDDVASQGWLRRREER